MEPLSLILVVAAVALVVYAFAAVNLVRRNKETPPPPWNRLQGLTWLAFAAAVVIVLAVAGALIVTIVGMADSLGAQLAFVLVSVILLGAFYVFLVHPLVRVLRARGVPGQGTQQPDA
ncbi:hypothetical protein [Tenggerimyces flavus]|uniref:Uncharacterized protein n=1 Tax=Tenggerimyces flavus TaxID=1708749 RepID=A0ABV7Y3T9_9ACTN|nr:hypothetical protein [Tenggerimyces flavus]MBM7788692.1 amino acid transporter [Tenggerimyces flavus]